MNYGDSGDHIKFKVSSTHFWGEDGEDENGQRNWTLTVKDLYGTTFSDNDFDGYLDHGGGILHDWTLTLYGDTDTNDDTYIYTNEFSNVYDYDYSRKTLSDDNGGTNTIKAISGNKNTSFREKSPKLGGFRGHKCGTFFQGNVLMPQRLLLIQP